MAKDNKDIKYKILNDEDFIYCPRLGNSINNLMNLNPNGVDNERIAKVLLIEETEVENIFQNAIEKIRKIMKIN